MTNGSTTRIAETLRQWVAGAASGARLPSTRELVAEHRASPVTVQRALRLLVAEGLVETRPGAGSFVREVRAVRANDYGWQTGALRSPTSRIPAIAGAMRPTSNDTIALHSGYPARDLLPERLVRSALARAARTDTALVRAPSAGLPGLQTWFANELAAATPAHVTTPGGGDVIVLPGSQSGLTSIFRAVVTAGAPVLMESPTYWGAITAAAQAGVRVVPVPSGPNGPDPDDVARAFEETGARAFYAQPNYASPTGAQWTPERAGRILNIARAHSAFLIEDDWAHDLSIDTDPRPVAGHDDTGHVIYLRSLTKSISPALRVAAVIARGPVRERILADTTADAMYVSGLLQTAALDVVTHPGWQTHLRALRHQLRTRRDLLIDSLREYAPEAIVTAIPAGGLNLWIRLPDHIDLTRLVRDCETAGVLIAPGNEWFPAEPTAPYLRLSYSGPNPGTYPHAAKTLHTHMQTQH